jgi:hypothetical protein
VTKTCHATVFLAAVWFAATTMVCHTFLAPCPTRHRLIFLPNFATNVASILLAKLSMAATVCQRLGVGHQPMIHRFASLRETKSLSIDNLPRRLYHNIPLTSFLVQNLSQLASINYDLLTKGLKDDQPPRTET